MGELKGKIGLEIHTYLVAKEKLFCKCKASRERGLKPNINICPICTGQPGAKPMLPNKEAVSKAVLIGRMLGCLINKNWKWQRKHYDWSDMPKGYQNTISGGSVRGIGVDGNFNGIGIWSLHLEEDPASWEPESGKVDYNRSGLPLVEIITAPDFESSSEVVSWLRKLVHNLSYLKVADSNAGIKVDVNINISGKSERVEVKNINSIENIGKAINYELERQSREGGKKKETRRYDALKDKTVVMRAKEGAEDYRFITDPDLIDVNLSAEFISEIEKKVPESPEKKLEKLIKRYKIDKRSASVLAKNIDIVEFFEEVIKESKLGVKFVLPWVAVELLRHLNYNKVKLDEVDIKVKDFVKLLELVNSGKITELQGKQILNRFYPESFDPSKEVEGKINDERELERAVKKVLEANRKAVEDYKKGEKNSFNFLMGQIMKETDKRADFGLARKVLAELLD